LIGLPLLSASSTEVEVFPTIRWAAVVSPSQASNLIDGWLLNGRVGEGSVVTRTMRNDVR